MDSYLLAFMLVGIPALLSVPLGKYLTQAMEIPTDYEAMGCGKILLRLDRILLKMGGRHLQKEQAWKSYCVSLLTFNLIMFLIATLVLTLQSVLPLNPDQKGSLNFDLIFNTAASFTTNTNLQHYSGEVSLSYFSQLFALMWLQFVSAATGLAAVTALARGLSGRKVFGNFYVDLMRASFYVLLPLAAIVAALLIAGGTAMTLDGAATVKTLEGAMQTIARGPVAAFVAIKQLGTNGGGFFGPNSTHPLENPSLFTYCIEAIAILLIPMAVVWMFGHITKRKGHAFVIFGVMTVLLLVKISSALYFENSPTAALSALPVEQKTPNLEGKELRFGSEGGTIWAVLTTATSNGSVAAMHDSLNPLTGLVPLVGMWLNVTFGGVGVGLINMFIFIIIAVFMAGMMVGRTPEYLTKKVETYEMKLALLAALLHPLMILVPTAIFAATSLGQATVQDMGHHGFSEILYEFSSAAANNGSGFEGLGDGTVAWNLVTGFIMIICRFVPIVLPLAIAGSLAAKKSAPETSGTLQTGTWLFGGMLLGTILLVGALLFVPFAVLGPIGEHLSR